MDLVNTLKTYTVLRNFVAFNTPLSFVDPSFVDNVCLTNAALSGFSIRYIDNDASVVVKGVFAAALASAAKAKLSGRSSLPFWNSYLYTFIPLTACQNLPAIAVKGLFFVGKRLLCHENDRKYPLTVNHSKRLERIVYIVATVALSTFLMPRLYAKLTNQPFTLSDSLQRKIFAVQLVWHIAIAEVFAHCAKQMRKEIKNDSEKWQNFFVSKVDFSSLIFKWVGLTQDMINELSREEKDMINKINYIFKSSCSFGDFGYDLERALIKRLTTNHLSISQDNQNEWKAFYKKYQGDFQSLSEKKNSSLNPKYPKVAAVIKKLSKIK